MKRFHRDFFRNVPDNLIISSDSLAGDRQKMVKVRRPRKSDLFLKILTFTSLYGLALGLYPPDCQWSIQNQVDRLNCLVQAGQSLIVEEEVFGIGPEHAKSLWVNCAETSVSNLDNNGFVLSHGVFMAVPNLRDLRLESCRIAGITPGALSYLPYLQNLTIRAHTSLTSWTPPPLGSSPVALEVKAGVLRGLPELRHLDLSTTSLSSLPSDFLCFLPSLTHLNLSGSWLRDFRSIGILPPDPTNPSNSCGTHITVLDLSTNHFTLLPPATFMGVKELVELHLSSNSITLAAERALLGLNQLEILSLAGNQLTSLPPEFFKDNRLLREIHLQNNSLGVLAPGLFNGLDQLSTLDLANNDLSSDWVNGETFRGLLRLVYLNLGNNRLTKVDPVLFRDLYSLQVLNLENNRIHHISQNALIGMDHLHTLILSHNRLKSLDERICNGLSLLSYLILDNNRIEKVGADSFRNCSNVEDLNLSGNKLKVIPEAISHLSLLRTLDLGENQMTEISNGSFEWKYLYGLRLTGNKIQKVAKDAFINLVSLKIVNLAENNITSLEPRTFDSNPNLHAIRLDVNRLHNISGLFRHIPNLLWLNISSNLLTHLDYEELPARLQLLNLQHNKIGTLSSALNGERHRIRTLDLSHNFLTEISSSILPESIEKLILNNNKITTIQPYTFFQKPNLTRVDLSHNQLVKLDQNALRLSPSRGTKASSPVEILIGHNPLHCDCSLEWLQGINGQRQFEVGGHYPLILDASEIKCSIAFDRTLENLSQLKMPPSQFLCKYETHCFSSCNCCDFDACDCQYVCPRNCSCYHDQGWSLNVVDCSMLEQTQIPGRIPMDVTALFLDGNVFPSLDSHAFIGRKNLRALYLNGSHIEIIQNRTFHGLRQLRVLHLENNFIEILDGFEFDELENLEELYLQQNSISWISNETFSQLHRLRILWLHGNNFVDLPIWSVTTGVGRLSWTINDLTLRGNEWSCECGFATAMKEWLLEFRAKVSDASQVHCVDQSPSHPTSYNSESNGEPSNELLVVRLLDQSNHRCSSSTDLSILEPSTDENPTWMEYIPLLVAILSLFLLFLVIFGFSFYWRQPLRVWFHAKCGLRLESCREATAERDKLFDAFISYSSKDEAWVRQVLAAELERQDPPFRLCLRYRDLPTGGTYLADTIVQASEASRRTVLVLSHHFLKGEEFLAPMEWKSIQ